MSDPASLVVATRGSRLARVQTERVAASLASAWPGLKLTTRVIRTSGDADRTTALADPGAEGWFTRELERTLLDGGADLAVHSLKDLPTRLPEGLRLLGCLERGDVRDLLIFGPADGGGDPVPAPGDVVATGSPRRRAEMERRFPGVVFAPMRGNVGTRLRKLRNDGAIRATILAAAGLERLGLFDGERVVDDEGCNYPFAAFGPPDYLPAPGQAVIGIEGCGREDLERIVAAITDTDALRCAVAERACMSSLGAGCRAPAGCWATADPSTGMLTLAARVLAVDGRRVVDAEVEGEDAEAIGAEAGRLILGRGGRRILEEIR